MPNSASIQARQALNQLSQQPLPQASDHLASQCFERHAKTLQAILERNPSLRFDVAEQIQQMIGRIMKQEQASEVKQLLELYLIEIEKSLPALISDRYIASWLWSADQSFANVNQR